MDDTLDAPRLYASVACGEFVSRDQGAEVDLDLSTQVVENLGANDGATIWRVTSDARVGGGVVSFTCQVRDDGNQWVLEQLTYD